MDDPPAAAVKKPCCVCDAPGGKHCTKCKTRHYCSKACQLVDWHERGHKAQCKRLAAEFQDRVLDSIMPEKLKNMEEPAIVADVAPAAGATAVPRAKAAPRASADANAPRAPAVGAGTTALVKAGAVKTFSWRSKCPICLDLLPVDSALASFYACCCKSICTACSVKCLQYRERCPLCLAPTITANAEMLRRTREHADNGNAEGQLMLGYFHRNGSYGLPKSPEQAVPLFKLAAAQGHAKAQSAMGLFHVHGEVVNVDAEAAAKWFRLGAAQDHPKALYNLGNCLGRGHGVPRDYDKAMRCFKRAAAFGQTDAPAAVESLEAWLAAARSLSPSLFQPFGQ